MLPRGISQAEDKIQLWHEEIEINHTQNMTVSASLKTFEDCTRGILAALRNVSIFGYGERRTRDTMAIECRLDHVMQIGQYLRRDAADYYKKNFCRIRLIHLLESMH